MINICILNRCYFIDLAVRDMDSTQFEQCCRDAHHNIDLAITLTTENRHEAVSE